MIYTPEEWMEDAECTRASDPDLFFAEGEQMFRKIEIAKKYCSRCGVSDECLRFALENKIDHGIFGGFNAAERRVMRRKSA